MAWGIWLSSTHAQNTKILSCKGLIWIPLPFTRAKYLTSRYVTKYDQILGAPGMRNVMHELKMDLHDIVMLLCRIWDIFLIIMSDKKTLRWSSYYQQALADPVYSCAISPLKWREEQPSSPILEWSWNASKSPASNSQIKAHNILNIAYCTQYSVVYLIWA